MVTYSVAEAQCESDGSFLAIPRSKAENDFIASLIPNEGIWIGINDIEQEGRYVTVDGSGISYTNWQKGQPDNHVGRRADGRVTPYDEDVIHISARDKKWNDETVDHLLKFVCLKSVSQLEY